MEVIKNKVLMVSTQEIIEERNDGGKKASYRIYELIKKVFGNDNIFLCMYTNHKSVLENPKIVRLKSHSNWMIRCFNVMTGHLFAGKKEEQKIIDLAKNNNIDIVLLDRSLHGRMIRELKSKVNCEIWVFVHNIERNYFKNKAKHENRLFYLPYLVIAKSEKETIKNADYIIGLTKRDAQISKKLYGKEFQKILPMAFYDEFNMEKRNNKHSLKSKELLFIGTLFPANYDGIKWFVQNVMPELENISLKIVGKNFEKRKKDLECENVKVIGTVDDLSPFYYENNIMVMPILYGDGIKIKTAEAMMYGKIILASDEALVGYDIEGVEGIYRCNSKEQFVKHIRELFSKENEFYSPSVRNCFLNKYCLDKQIEECGREWISRGNICGNGKFR